MIQKKITRTVALSLIMIWALTTVYTTQIIAVPQQQMPIGAQLTPEDLQAMERAVEEERAKMSPEERAQFDNDVEQLTKELEAMKPEELESFMNQVLFGQPEQVPQEAPAVVLQPEPTPAAIAKPEPVKAQKPRKKQDEALIRINGIINYTTSFLNKIARYIEFVGKLKKWSEQGKINGWKPNYTWDSIKKQIENLTNTLTLIKDKDPKTGDYKYLNDLIDDESLYNNLGKLHDALSKLEPDVEIDDFGVDPVSRQVRYLIRKLLAEYIEAFDVLNIPSDLDKLIAKYEPTAKKHREEQESLTKKSLEESKAKQQRRVTPAVVGGKGDRENSYSGGYASGSNPYDYYPYSGGYSPSSYSSYGNDSSNTSGYQPPKPPSASSGSHNGSIGGGTKAPQERSDKNAKDEKKEENKKPSERKSKDANNKTDKLIETFKESLEEVVDILNDKDTPLSTISDSASTRDQDEKIMSTIKGANLDIEVNVLRTLGKLKKVSLSNAQKTEIQSIYNKQKKSLDEIIKSIDTIDANKVTMSDAKKNAFDMLDKEPQEPTSEDEIVSVVRKEQSPYRLKDNIANIKKAYDALFPTSN